MRFLKYLNEKYCCGGKTSWGNYVEFWVNPDDNDVEDLVKAYYGMKDATDRKYNKSAPIPIRVTADNKKKKVFVWLASICNHAEAGRILSKKKKLTNVIEDKISYDPNFLNLGGWATGNKLTLDECDDVYYGDMISKLKLDWKWLKPYFDNFDSYMKSLRREVKSAWPHWEGD